MSPHATHRPSAVRLEAVTKTYLVGEPVHALDDLTLEIPQGSFTAVMGPSGSGKSTLMNLIGLLAGMVPAFRAARLDPIEALRHE